MTIQEAFELAIEHHQSGRLTDAEAIYRQILLVEPHHADSLHLLGVLMARAGRNELAVQMIRQAIALIPNVSFFHSNLGNSLRELGQYDEAIAAYHRALEIAPDFADGHNNLGTALLQMRRFDEAIGSFRRAIAINANCAPAHSNLGNALREQGRFDEAIAAHREALRIDPNVALTHNSLGIAMADRGLWDEAIAAYRRAIELWPDYAQAFSNLGAALKQCGKFEESIAMHQRAITLQPAFAQAHCNLGTTLEQEGRFEEAVTAYLAALRLKPDLVEAHCNLANTHWDMGLLEEAVAGYRRALAIKPTYAEARSNLLLALHYVAGMDPDSIFREHRLWDELHARALRDTLLPYDNSPAPERRLRVGYLSPDFRMHSVASFFEGLLARHDPAEVEVFLYASHLRADTVTDRFRQATAHWREITGLSDERAAGIVREDGIDILVDLAGHTGQQRLLIFARKPAPVQVTYLGYCDTTGLDVMDYRLTDAYADPPGMTEHLHSEQLVRLPKSAWCFQPTSEAPPVAGLPALSAGSVTFGSFNALPKITEAGVSLWARILLEVPNSRLLLKNSGFQDAGVQRRLRKLFKKSGIGPERIELLGRLPNFSDHLGCYNQVDIALDTFLYHGTTTTCEALWMGVPVISLAGRTHASRTGVSLLNTVGLSSLLAVSEEEYIQLAVGLAKDLPRLASLRASMRERMQKSALTDAQGFARDIEAAFRQMWRTWCAKRSSPKTS